MTDLKDSARENMEMRENQITRDLLSVNSNEVEHISCSWNLRITSTLTWTYDYWQSQEVYPGSVTSPVTSACPCYTPATIPFHQTSLQHDH